MGVKITTNIPVDAYLAFQRIARRIKVTEYRLAQRAILELVERDKETPLRRTKRGKSREERFREIMGR